MNSYGWLFDPKRCIECRACESACKQWNWVETAIDVRYRRVRTYETGAFPRPATQALSIACNHCENSYCVKACPVGAMWRRDDGIVLVDREKCTGCRECEQFCPYGAPQFNRLTKKMEKCTLCADRLEESLAPACVTLCPTGALQYGKWDEVSRQGADRVPGFSNPALTRPRIRFVQAQWGAR